MKYTKMVKLYEEDIFKAATPEDSEARNIEYQKEYKEKIEEIVGGPIEVGDYILKTYTDINLHMYLWRVYEVNNIDVTLLPLIVDKKDKAVYDNPTGVDEGDRYEWRDLHALFYKVNDNRTGTLKMLYFKQKDKDLMLKTYADIYNTYWVNDQLNKYMQAIDWKEWEGIDEI